MTPKTSRATAAAPPAAPCEPSDPLAPVAAEGDRSPSSPLLEAAAKGSPDVPEGGAATPGEGGSRSRLPGDPPALSGAEGRAAWQAALSANAKGQRNRRARPWTKRDPYRKAVPGGRKPPPGGEAG